MFNLSNTKVMSKKLSETDKKIQGILDSLSKEDKDVICHYFALHNAAMYLGSTLSPDGKKALEEISKILFN